VLFEQPNETAYVTTLLKKWLCKYHFSLLNY